MIWRCAGDFLNIPDTRINLYATSIFQKARPNVLVKLGPCHHDIYKTDYYIGIQFILNRLHYCLLGHDTFHDLSTTVAL